MNSQSDNQAASELAKAQANCVLGSPGYVDAFEFARRGQIQVGVVSIHRFQRLLDGLPEQPVAELLALSGAPAAPGLVKYTIEGLISTAGKAILRLHVQAQVLLECQRCLGPLVQVIDRETRFELVRRETDIVESPDEEVGDDEPEQIVGSRRFDLQDLIEDELILEVPYVPRHEMCVDMTETEIDPSDEADGQERPSPFAVLGQLKSKG